ncbi:MAG: peptidoglycan DD-metalloendopeptidase family protein [Tannerella sp.]|jgi:murein DD-endopeptidase MepM/ murein hydrolase activator NlpD|nr:peptidoglycan DD-metalloendopeptidase family protein [Tannerella sp.]
MKLYILLTALFLPLCFQTQSQTYSGLQPNTTIDANSIKKKNQDIKKQASELTAKHIPLTKLEANSVTKVKIEEYKEQVNRENLMFPADELYNSIWDTLHVNPFFSQKINFPESYTINCNSFIMPIDNDVKITSKYGPRGRRMHRGIDLKVQTGDTIRAAFDGKIRIKSYERRGYGYYLVIRHPNGLETVYGHLSKFLVKENDIIRAGEPIALGGNTGKSSGPHLHFETRFLGRDINPADIIDFENGEPYKDEYVFNNVKINGKGSNIYTSSDHVYAVHSVKKGETLSEIAKKYGTTVNELCRLNNITVESKLAIGQRIRFQTRQIKVQVAEDAVKQTDTENNIKADLKSNNGKPDKKIEIPAEKTDESPKASVYHEIKKGDTLFSLSKKYGISIEKLCELNSFGDNIIIKIGQKIRCS